MAAAFISYRRDDAAGYAGRLRESLERRIGEARVFRDVDTLQPGQDFVQAIDERLRECRVMLAVIGREWLDARGADGQRRLDDPYDFVRLEIAAALARPEVLVVPVLVEGAAMPPASALPETIRPLARRHAVSVRDETWDADIERLAALIDRAAAPASGTADWRRRRRLLVPLLASAGIAGAIVLTWWMASGPAADRTTISGPVTSGLDSGSAPAGTPFTIDIPRLAEAAFQQLTYSVVSGNVVFRDSGPELRLRIRLSNGGPTAVNFWDDTFRLATGSQLLSPTSGLNLVMAGHSLGYGIVTFALPPGSARATLQIRQQGSIAGIPLDLAATGRAPVDELAEIADSLSQALVKPVVAGPEGLLQAGGMSVTIDRASRRQFANAVRLRVALRIRNDGPGARFSGDLTVRAVTGSDTVAPWDFMGTAIPANSTTSSDATFDLPASATTATLRATLGEVTRERQLDLR